jgi:lipopolysaccharide transport system ATP-binding protein
MQDVSKGEGRTVLFVSHNMGAVKQLCTKGIVLENGEVVYQSAADKAVSFYLKNQDSGFLKYIEKINYFTSGILLTKMEINNNIAGDIYLPYQLPKITLSVEGYAERVFSLAFEIRIYDIEGILIAIYSPGYTKDEIINVSKGSFVINDEFELPSGHTKGTFYLEIKLVEPKIDNVLTLDRQVKVETEGFTSPSGFVFDYQWNGLMVL